MSQACQWFTVLQLALPLLCVLNFFPYITRHGVAGATLAGLVLYQGVLIATPLLLGNIGYLHVEAYRGVMIAISTILAARAAWRVRSIARELSSIRYRPQLIDPVIGVALYLCLSLYAFQLTNGWSHGPSEFDAVNYHIPRVLQWSWNGNFRPWPTCTWQQIAHAYGGSSSLLPSIFLGCGYVTFSWAAAFYTLGAALSVYVLARGLHCSARASLVAALAFLSFPAIGLRLGGVNTDIAATFPVLAAIAFFRSCYSVEKRVFAFVTLCCIGMATKQYVLFPVVLIGSLFFFTSLRQLRSTKVLSHFVAGSLCGGGITLLSYYPVYVAFGDVNGGGADLSNLGKGWRAVFDSLGYTFVNWLSEPLSLFPRARGEELFEFFHIDDIYRFIGMSLSKSSISSFNGNELRSGALPLLLTPWLILAVNRGYRWITLFGFIALIVIQIGPLSMNFTGRFLNIPLAAFALLWGQRARRSMLLVTLCVIAALAINRDKVGMKDWWPTMRSEIINHYGDCIQLEPLVQQDTMLLLTRPLGVDARVAGRLARTRFQYFGCPEEGDWLSYLRGLRDNYAWLGFFPEQGLMATGPAYVSRFRPKTCNELRLSAADFRQVLEQAGWRSVSQLECGLELWRSGTGPDLQSN